MKKTFSIILFSFLLFSCQESIKKDVVDNVAVIDKFFELVFANPEGAKDLLHEDFTFKFMGICEICKSHNRDTFISDWLQKEIPAVLPNGIKLNPIRKINGGDNVVFLVEGEPYPPLKMTSALSS